MTWILRVLVLAATLAVTSSILSTPGAQAAPAAPFSLETVGYCGPPTGNVADAVAYYEANPSMAAMSERYVRSRAAFYGIQPDQSFRTWLEGHMMVRAPAGYELDWNTTCNGNDVVNFPGRLHVGGQWLMARKSVSVVHSKLNLVKRNGKPVERGKEVTKKQVQDKSGNFFDVITTVKQVMYSKTVTTKTCYTPVAKGPCKNWAGGKPFCKTVTKKITVWKKKVATTRKRSKPTPPIVPPSPVVVCTGLKVAMTGNTSVRAEVSLSRSDVLVVVQFATRPEGSSQAPVPLVPTGQGQVGSVRQELDWRQLGRFELVTLIHGVVQDNCKTGVQFGGGATPTTTPPVTPPAAVPPTVSLTLPSPGHGFTVNGSGQLCATAGIPAGHGATIVFSATLGTTSTPYQVDAQTWCTWYTAPATAGTETVSVRVTDTNTGLAASDSGQFIIASYGF